MKNIFHLFFFAFLVFVNSRSNGQIPVSDKIQPSAVLSLKDKVNKSDAVIEGVVINDTRRDGFWGPNGHYTSIIIRVSKIFKGSIKDSIIELVTDGGTIPSGKYKGNQSSSVWGFLGKDEEGIFFLRNNTTAIQSSKNVQSFFFLYSSSLIVYNNPRHSIYATAYYNGKNISDFENVLYKPIETITGMPRKIIALNSFEAAKSKQK